MDLFTRALLRLGRVGVSLFLASAAAWATNDPRWVWLAPVISAAGKVLREKTGKDIIPF